MHKVQVNQGHNVWQTKAVKFGNLRSNNSRVASTSTMLAKGTILTLKARILIQIAANQPEAVADVISSMAAVKVGLNVRQCARQFLSETRKRFRLMLSLMSAAAASATK